MDRFICIHGHFYQPPRENPWLEAVEVQDSAHPYHDWNERITEECYAANARARILDHEGRILHLMNNYARISFNFGPTLLCWLEAHAPEVYDSILEADRRSVERFSGRGSALAQPYNHMIMPLAHPRDKRTQIIWGIRDFVCRFGRNPTGMWLPETAVDLETLDIMAEHGITFTILAPQQAAKVRPRGSETWIDLSQGAVDPTMPYGIRLPSGRTFHIFFYDRDLSRAVAFEHLLKNGDLLVQRLMGAFQDRPGSQLVHIATDGETYGHHHPFGEMALAYALEAMDNREGVRLTNYAEFLDRYPPVMEVQIAENTSWSCTHGIERWRDDCGCRTGGQPHWNQAWRRPLREALDSLREALDSIFEDYGKAYLKDPWTARDAYIEVLLHRTPETVENFLRDRAVRPDHSDSRIQALKLLEMQRHGMLMYTSCGWFFSELSGIETVQILRYAGRAIQLARELTGANLESHFLGKLEKAKSNIPAYGNGRSLYRLFVEPARVGLEQVGAHWAIHSLLGTNRESEHVYCYRITPECYRSWEAGRTRLAVGRIRVSSMVTQEEDHFGFGVLHLGDHNLHCGIRRLAPDLQVTDPYGPLIEAFQRADLTMTLRHLDSIFKGSAYTLRSLFRDEQRRVLNWILESTCAQAEKAYRQLHTDQAPLLRFLKGLDIPPPKVLYQTAQWVLNTLLKRALSEEALHPGRVLALLEEAQEEGVELDSETLAFAYRQALERKASMLREQPRDPNALDQMDSTLALLPKLPFQVNLWKVQKLFYEAVTSELRDMTAKADAGDPAARLWIKRIHQVGDRLWINMEALANASAGGHP